MFSEDITYAADELKQLIGFTIVDTVVTPDKEQYGFVVQSPRVRGKQTKKVCWVDMDPEGNGPGWISIQEQKSENNTASG